MVDVGNESEAHDEQVDEYLWPLTDAAWPLDWRRFAEEHRLRKRLNEILDHVHATHVAPRLRRLGANNPGTVAALTERIISGPQDGEPWRRVLHEPVPRALRDEWATLSAELRDVTRAARSAARRRS